MLKYLLSKIIRLQQVIYYYFIYKNKLFKIGRKTILFEPIRLENEQYISIDDFVSIQAGSWIYASNSGNAPKVTIGKNCILGYRNHIAAINSVTIEDDVLTANGVYISDNLHSYEDIHIPIKDQKLVFRSNVTIGKGSWIGENACIIGANIGRNCVIGANCVVTKDIPDYCVAVGAPARVIKQFDINMNKWITKK